MSTPPTSPAPRSVQETYAPNNACFGCGTANSRGLRLRSFEQGDLLVAAWQPEPHHEAFPSVLSGGIVGTLLDCHGDWAASMHLMRRRAHASPPCVVTAEFTVKLLWPTPTKEPVHLVARVVESTDDRATVEATLTAEGKVCASFRGSFVAVKPGHPAYHRW